MSDAAVNPEEQKSELARAGLGGAAAEGAVAAHLHHDQAIKQSKDVQVGCLGSPLALPPVTELNAPCPLSSTQQAQQLAEQTGARATEKNKAYHNDPVRQPGLGHTASSRHAQMGSHGLSGQAPK